MTRESILSRRRSLAGLLLISLVLAVTAALVSSVTRRNRANIPAGTAPALATPHIDVVAELERGVSLDRVRAVLGQEPRHQFTSRVNSEEYLCVSYAFGEPYARLYFLFRDGRLEKITEPPPFAYQTAPYRGATLEKRLPVDPHVRVAEVMQAPDLGGTRLRRALAARLPKGRESSNVVPAFVAERMAADEPARRKQYARNEQRATHFDGRRVRIGDSLGQVTDALGQPLQSAAAAPRSVRVYGSTEPLPMVNHAYRFSPVEIHFEHDRVVAVFGNDFVNTLDGKMPKQ
jgi:hypothetical protein